MTSFEGMLAWMRDTLEEARGRRREDCPRCGYPVQEVDGRLWCPFDGWRET